MSEAAELPDPAALQAALDKALAELGHLAPIREAIAHYATARAKLPAPGKEFRGPKDAENFQAYFVALLALERAAMAHAGRSVKQ